MVYVDLGVYIEAIKGIFGSGNEIPIEITGFPQNETNIKSDLLFDEISSIFKIYVQDSHFIGQQLVRKSVVGISTLF